MLHSLPAIIGTAVAMIVCLSAMVLGGPTERFAGAMLLVVNFAEAVIQSHSDWAGPQYALLLLDLITFAACIGLVLKSDRGWTVFLASYYGLTCVTHVAILLEPNPSWQRTWAYITGLVTWGYLVWACLLWGTISAWRRRGKPNLPQIWRGNGSQ